MTEEFYNHPTGTIGVKEGVRADAEALGIDPIDVARIRKLRIRRRILLAVVGILTAVISFVAGGITREILTTGYPFSIASPVSISGAVIASSAVDRGLKAFVILLLAVASFVLGYLLTGGETQTSEYPQGAVPAYGVYCS